MLSWNRVGLWAALIAFAVISIPAAVFAVNYLPTGEREAIITMGRNPEPPECALPQDLVTMWWNITYSTTPQYVYYKLTDPNGITVEDSTYAGASGVSINRQWLVPNFPVEGKYWIRVEFWSMQAGHESTAEVSFYVCAGSGRICAQKWKDANCNGQGDAEDVPLSGWWLCIDTPWGDTFCDTTGADGQICWENLPFGLYTVYDPPVPGWIPLFPPAREADLTENDPDKLVAFFNVKYDECYGACCKCDGECVEVTRIMCDEIGYEFMGLGTFCKDTECGAPSATKRSTWGKIKDSFRK